MSREEPIQPITYEDMMGLMAMLEKEPYWDSWGYTPEEIRRLQQALPARVSVRQGTPAEMMRHEARESVARLALRLLGMPWRDKRLVTEWARH